MSNFSKLNMSNFTELQSKLDSIQAHEKDALEFLRNFKSSALISVLQEILETPELLLQVASQSYIHQLEFEKFVIAKSSSGRWLRIHHWPSKINLKDQDVHSHCANFASKILNGSLEH